MRISDIMFFLSEKIKTEGDLKTEGIEIYSDGSYKFFTSDYGTEVGHIQIDYEGEEDDENL